MKSALKPNMGKNHPECPARILAVYDQRIASGLMSFLDRQEVSSAGNSYCSAYIRSTISRPSSRPHSVMDWLGRGSYAFHALGRRACTH
ncbi:MAG: hypothetical protein IPP22_12240 [Nitrosomonas sp.]|nr:hypothetical protein [Nitrosomonas sp.]